MPIFLNPIAFHNRLALLKLVDIVNKSEFVCLWRTLFQVLLPCQCIDPHYFTSTSRIKVRGPDSVVAQGWFQVIQKSFLLVACVDKHRNTKKCRGRTSQSLEKDLLSESSFPSWFHTSVNSLGHCNIYCFIYNEYIITTIFHFPGFFGSPLQKHSMLICTSCFSFSFYTAEIDGLIPGNPSVWQRHWQAQSSGIILTKTDFSQNHSYSFACTKINSFVFGISHAQVVCFVLIR